MIEKKLLCCGLAVVAALSGCATSGVDYRPMVDTKGVDMNKFEADLGECRQYATQVMGAAESAAIGAAAGAVFGAILATAAGRNYDRGATTRVAGITGAAAGAVEGEQNQRNIIRNCMSGRGYRVLQ